MLILAAALLFTPHYEVTLHRTFPGNSAAPPVSDAKGNVYFISDYDFGPTGGLPLHVTRIDPDGNVVYRVDPVNGSFCQRGPMAPDPEQNLYVVTTCSIGTVLSKSLLPGVFSTLFPFKF